MELPEIYNQLDAIDNEDNLDKIIDYTRNIKRSLRNKLENKKTPEKFAMIQESLLEELKNEAKELNKGIDVEIKDVVSVRFCSLEAENRYHVEGDIESHVTTNSNYYIDELGNLCKEFDDRLNKFRKRIKEIATGNNVNYLYLFDWLSKFKYEENDPYEYKYKYEFIRKL